jgi:pyrimidine operon attenuation protein/uracil phosphoribosyltransferase
MTATRVLMDHDDVRRVVARMAHEIDDRVRAAEREPLAIDPDRLAIVGVRTGGAFIAQRIAAALLALRGRAPDVGLLDITLYRDDVLSGAAMPTLRGTEIPFDVEGRPVVLVDDVLFTGRTVRAALDALLDVGRPSCVLLAVLIDRGLRELPITPDFVGRAVKTSRAEHVSVQLTEAGAAADVVELSVDRERRQA